jgi:hypothetical protein
MRWADGRFTPDFVHRDFHATLTATDLTFTIARADLHARSFDFAVASLRQQADLAPGGGVARYPRRGPGRHGRSHAGACPVVTEQAARHVNRKGATRHADHCSTASASQCRAMSGDTSVTGS